jgi:hypothetical protein
MRIGQNVELPVVLPNQDGLTATPPRARQFAAQLAGGAALPSLQPDTLTGGMNAPSKNDAGTATAAKAMSVNDQMKSAVMRFSEQAGPTPGGTGGGALQSLDAAPPGADPAAAPPAAMLEFLAGRLASDPNGLDKLRAMPERVQAQLAGALLGMLASKPGQDGAATISTPPLIGGGAVERGPNLFGPQPVGISGNAPGANPQRLVDAGGDNMMPSEFIRAYDGAVPKMRTADPNFRPHHSVFAENEAQAKNYVGLTKEEALAKAASEGKTVDIVKEDGRAKWAARAAVYLADRVNLTVEQGRVSEASSG